jgi:hypothetical protein
MIYINIHAEYHTNVFVPGTTPNLSSQQVDSISSCNYLSYATNLFSNYNPQDGDITATPSAHKQIRIANITNAKIGKPQSPTNQFQASLSTLTDIDKRYDAMSAQFGDQFGSKVSISDLEKQKRKL